MVVEPTTERSDRQAGIPGEGPKIKIWIQVCLDMDFLDNEALFLAVPPPMHDCVTPSVRSHDDSAARPP